MLSLLPSLNFQKRSPFHYGLWKCMWLAYRCLYPYCFLANKLLLAVMVKLICFTDEIQSWRNKISNIDISNFWGLIFPIFLTKIKLTHCDGICGFWWTKILKRIEKICKCFCRNSTWGYGPIVLGYWKSFWSLLSWNVCPKKTAFTMNDGHIDRALKSFLLFESILTKGMCLVTFVVWLCTNLA